MPRNLVIAGVVVFWLTMMTLLVKREVLPAWRAAHRPPYRRAVAEAREDLPKRSQMAILMGQRRVGTYRNVMRRDTDGALLVDGAATVDLMLPLLRLRGRFELTGRMRIGADGRLKRFDTVALTPLGRVVMTGEVVGRELVTTVGEGANAQVTRRPIDERAVLLRDLAPLEALGDLHVGDSWYVTSLSPLLKSNTALVQVRERQTIVVQDRPVDTFLLVMLTSESTAELRAWVEPDGEVVRQELPYGFVMERETYAEPANHPSPLQGEGRVRVGAVAVPETPPLTPPSPRGGEGDPGGAP